MHVSHLTLFWCQKLRWLKRVTERNYKSQYSLFQLNINLVNISIKEDEIIYFNRCSIRLDYPYYRWPHIAQTNQSFISLVINSWVLLSTVSCQLLWGIQKMPVLAVLTWFIMKLSTNYIKYYLIKYNLYTRVLKRFGQKEMFTFVKKLIT